MFVLLNILALINVFSFSFNFYICGCFCVAILGATGRGGLVDGEGGVGDGGGAL